MIETITGNYTIKQILKDFWDDFYSVYSDRIRKVVSENVARVMRCRDAKELGYSVYSCPTCDEKHMVAHTCKSRFCNACGKVKNDEWIIKSQDRLLNVPHKHLVFSTPWELRPFFRLKPPSVIPSILQRLRRYFGLDGNRRFPARSGGRDAYIRG